MTRHLYIITALAFTVTAAPQAQNIASRVRSVGTGTVRFSYDVKPDVCGNGGNGFSWGKNNQFNWSGNVSSGARRRGESENVCDSGPARVALEVERGRVVGLRHYVGGRWSTSADGDDMGRVDAGTASDYFLGLVEDASAAVAKPAILAAIVAAQGDPYPTLLRVAKNQDRVKDVRRDAIFWLGQEAGEIATRGLKTIIDNDGDREIKKQAVFALSQQHNGAGVEALIEVVRTNKDPELRKTALFWLGQTDDPRALKLIEELILRR